MHAAKTCDTERFLEVGHYYGLSTCALVHALRDRWRPWSLVTVDAHIPDPWVEREAPIRAFESNRDKHFKDDRLIALFDRSETIDHINAGFVFYDGDHGAEQLRFTRAVIVSPSVRRFLFDDRDFDFPKVCAAELVEAGWTDMSPRIERLPADKANPDTQTIAWFER